MCGNSVGLEYIQEMMSEGNVEHAPEVAGKFYLSIDRDGFTCIIT